MAKKHFENIIGKIIYGTLLFMPLLNVLGTSIYAIANKNAYESYYGETINENNRIALENNKTDTNTKYYLTLNSELPANDTNLYISNIAIENAGTLSSTNIDLINNNASAIYRLYFYTSNNVKRVDFYIETESNYQWLLYLNLETNNVEISFNTISQQNAITPYLEYYQPNKYSYLDNAFEFGIYKTENSPYYNWTKDTAINDVIHQTTTTLGINNSFVDLLLTYWLLMTIIYVIYDLGLMLIQIAHKKVHKICDKD